MNELEELKARARTTRDSRPPGYWDDLLMATLDDLDRTIAIAEKLQYRLTHAPLWEPRALQQERDEARAVVLSGRDAISQWEEHAGVGGQMGELAQRFMADTESYEEYR